MLNGEFNGESGEVVYDQEEEDDDDFQGLIVRLYELLVQDFIMDVFQLVGCDIYLIEFEVKSEDI